MKLQTINLSKNQLPQYATPGSAGLDLRASLVSPVTLEPGQTKLIATGLHMCIPKNYVGLVCPRSGLALKHGVTCGNAPGVVDSDYRGDVGVILINHGTEPFTVNPGDRIAQLVLLPCLQGEVLAVETLGETERGEGGFGHSGIK